MADPEEERLFTKLAKDKLARQLPLYAEERAELLDEKSRHEDRYIRASVASHDDTPADVLKRLVFDPDPLVREAVARNRDVAADILMHLASDPDPSVLQALSKNWELPVEVALHLAHHASDEVAGNLLLRLETNPSILEVLSTRSEELRMKVAMNWKCPEHLLRRLAHDDAVIVQLAVAQNPLSPASALRQLADAESIHIRAFVAVHANAPADLIALLCARDPRIRKFIDDTSEKPDSDEPAEPTDSPEPLQ